MSNANSYLTVFGYQSRWNLPSQSHTFATFSYHLEEEWEHVTISWMPKTGLVNIWNLPEIGTNWTLQKSLLAAEHAGLALKNWGPYKWLPTLN